MTDSFNPFYDRNVEDEADRQIEAIEDKEKEVRLLQQEKSIRQATEDEERTQELAAPHATKEAKDFGLRENLTELKNAITGGTRDTISSYATLPERAVDIA